VNETTSSPLKVAYVVGQLGVGGAERQLLKKMIHLRKLGLEMVVIALAGGGSLSEDFERENFSIYQLSRGHNLELGRVLKLASILRAEKPQIVHGEQYGAGGYARLAGFLAGTPIQVLAIRSAYPVVRARYRFAEKLLGPRTDAYVVNAEAIKRRTVEHHGIDPDKIHVILNVYDPPTTEPLPAAEMRTKLGIAPDKLIVGIIASFDTEKNHVLFLKFAREVSKTRSDVVFLCVGDGRQRPLREAEAKEYGISDQVHFLGTRRDITDLLGVFDVSVNCSIREGLCNAIIESVAAGVPILASNVGGTPEIVVDREHGRLFESNNVESMTATFFELIEDLPGYRARIAAYLPSFLGSLSGDHIVKELHDFYRNLVNAKLTS